MRLKRLFGLTLAAAFLFGGIIALPPAAAIPSPKLDFKRAKKTFENGNFKDAYEMFRKSTLRADEPSEQVCEQLQLGTNCLQRLNRVAEIDAFREAVVEAHADDWRVLWAAAKNCMSIPHQGAIVAGKFVRGGRRRGGGQFVNTLARDRVRAMQLMVKALPSAQRDDNRGEVSNFFNSFAGIVLGGRGYGEAWRLQILTELVVLPDYEPGWGRHYGGSRGAPVDAEGNPVFYQVPNSFDAAESDGQRWRWCLAQVVEYEPSKRNQTRLDFAGFLYSQFGVQTMAHGGWRIGRLGDGDGDDEKDKTGPFALHTLAE
ncbi:MAG: alpha-2-macroglobulin, partial [Planctomycetota bacterium]|nr:alpha-2-macroglobulin [Planctomycetota bacterium]